MRIRKSCACSIFGSSSAMRSKARACDPAKMWNWKPSGACSRMRADCWKRRGPRSTLCTNRPNPLCPLVKSVARKLDDLAKIDEQMGAMRQALEPALIAIQDVSYSLRDYLGRVEANPARLEEIENAPRGARQTEAQIRRVGG